MIDQPPEEEGTPEPPPPGVTAGFTRSWFGPDQRPWASMLVARWIFLRGLGLIFFSAFFSLWFQIQGMIGPDGILPASGYLSAVRSAFPRAFLWFAPTILWLDQSAAMLNFLVVAGMAASIVLTLNFWPRLSIAICIVLFLSFVAATDVFSSYQSDGMLLEAAFISLFLAPAGFRPRLGARPPSRAAVFLLQWEWFRIHFESGLVKLMSGDPQWRSLTAMVDYYQNLPLPTWVGWYAAQLPRIVHQATALWILIVELFLCWMVFIPAWAATRPLSRSIFHSGEPTEVPEDPYRTIRRWRIAVFLITTSMQIGIILTANYAFLNYIVLLLGVMFLDDKVFRRLRLKLPAPGRSDVPRWRLLVPTIALSWIFYATIAGFFMIGTGVGPLTFPAVVLEPFRIANNYGLFAVMTPARYEIEFQGSLDGEEWIPYPFPHKPQKVDEPPGIYAPYQPRFEWNLWFASLGSWLQNPWVVNTEVRLAEGSPPVLALFDSDPFAGRKPRRVRAVLWRYWFSDPETRERTGHWWRREFVRWYAPPVERRADGTIVVLQ